MATYKITDLADMPTPAKTDIVEMVDLTGPTTKSVTIQHLVAAATAEAATPGAVKQMAVIAALAQTTSNPPTQAEVQAIATKLDALIAALKTAGAMHT